MKKKFYLFAFAFAIASMLSCSDNSKNEMKTEESVVEEAEVDLGAAQIEEMEAFVSQIYDKMVDAYNSGKRTSGIPDSDIYSKSWCEVSKKVQALQRKSGRKILGSENSYWVKMNKVHKLSYTLDNSSTCSDTQGIVAVRVCDEVNGTPSYEICYFSVVKEDGNWKVDDILWSEDVNNGEKAILEKELSA